jgi:hypothetical protein
MCSIEVSTSLPISSQDHTLLCCQLYFVFQETVFPFSEQFGIPGKLESTAVLRAICAGFKETTEPHVCLTPGSQPPWMKPCLINRFSSMLMRESTSAIFFRHGDRRVPRQQRRMLARRGDQHHGLQGTRPSRTSSFKQIAEHFILPTDRSSAGSRTPTEGGFASAL